MKKKTVPVSITTPAVQGNIATTSATAQEGWQTYRNDKYGIEFKYPPRMKVKQNEKANGDLFIALLADNDQLTFERYGTLGIWASTTKSDAQDYFDYKRGVCRELYAGNMSEIQFAGYKAINCTPDPETYGSGAYLWLISNSGNYEIGYSFAHDGLYADAQKILDTFRFY